MSDTAYESLISNKLRPHMPNGVRVGEDAIHPRLFVQQSAITRWALRMGQAAVFTDTGTGKSAMQCEFSRQVQAATGGKVLIFSPLAVASQTIEEASLQGLTIKQVRHGDEVRDSGPGVFIVNYDRHKDFFGLDLAGLVLDESAILRDYTSATRNALIEQAQGVPFRAAFTATPAPNDYTELGNTAEFLGICSRVEMLATYFVNSGVSGDEKWQLRGHAEDHFYRWLASWAVFMRKPSDLGFSDAGYELPPLEIREVVVPCDVAPEGMLFATGATGVSGQAALRRSTLAARVDETVRLVLAEPNESWILWTGLNTESDALEKALKGKISLVRVEGKDSEEDKIERLRAFKNGEVKVLITKSRVAGTGLNLQICGRQAFVGLNYSFSDFYQNIRRSYRFGRRDRVVVFVVVSEAEYGTLESVKRKEEDARRMAEQIIAHTGDLNKAALQEATIAEIPPGYLTTRTGDGWVLHHGDCVEVMRDRMEENSVDLTVFSPPFEALYTYSDNPRDMGNSTPEDFWAQFAFFVRELLRVLKRGRIAAVHVAQLASTYASDGVSGLKDFRGKTIAAFQEGGWVYHGDTPVDKDCQGQAIRTRAHALLFKTFDKDRTDNRPALADYFLIFKKPGENAVPVVGGIDRETWIKWANSVWIDIRESYTLNAKEAKGDKDARHLCPLQLDAISRCVQLWSNPGEVVFTPFLGCGSEVYQALLDGRQAIGIELKPEYFRTACVNARRAEVARGQQSLFACAPETSAPTTTEIPPEWIREALGAVYRDITEAQKAAMELRALLGEAA